MSTKRRRPRAARAPGANGEGPVSTRSAAVRSVVDHVDCIGAAVPADALRFVSSRNPCARQGGMGGEMLYMSCPFPWPRLECARLWT